MWPVGAGKKCCLLAAGQHWATLAVALLAFLAVLRPGVVEPFDRASIRALIDKTRLDGEGAVYVADVATSLGLGHTHNGVLVKQIEVAFSSDHRRFITVTERDEVVLTYRRRPGAYSLVTNALA